MKVSDFLDIIECGAFDGRLLEIYGPAALTMQRLRFTKALLNYKNLFGDDDVSLFSVPGRIEICGNHTDHNHGCVMAASINLDIIAVAAKRSDGIITVQSEGFSPDTISCADLTPHENERFTSAAILRGTAAGLTASGYRAGGFTACTTSDIFVGSGLSSSAAFEIMCGTIQNHFYNGGNIPPAELARIGQYAENEFFGKPCGLMDQTACAWGGIITIDFGSEKPLIQSVDTDFSAYGYSICIVMPGGNHAELSAAYAAIRTEMQSVARALGAEYLRDVPYERFLGALPGLKGRVSDRALLRAYHFYRECARVQSAADSLSSGDIDGFLQAVNASGISSFEYNQNIYADPAEQPVSLALMLSESVLGDTEYGMKGAWRVHGGGFAGTILAFVPEEKAAMYRDTMCGVFGPDACRVLSIRGCGAVILDEAVL